MRQCAYCGITIRPGDSFFEVLQIKDGEENTVPVCSEVCGSNLNYMTIQSYKEKIEKIKKFKVKAWGYETLPALIKDINVSGRSFKVILGIFVLWNAISTTLYLAFPGLENPMAWYYHKETTMISLIATLVVFMPAYMILLSKKRPGKKEVRFWAMILAVNFISSQLWFLILGQK